MQFFSVPRSVSGSISRSIKGFTLIESVVAIVVLGILASIAAPNLLIWYSNKQVEQGLGKIQGALLEAQRQAMRQSRNCIVTIPSGADVQITASPASCVSTDLASTRTLQKLAVRRSNLLATVTFDYKGETADQTATVVVSTSSGGTAKQTCLVLSGPLGLMRTGTYLSTDTTGTSDANCQ